VTLSRFRKFVKKHERQFAVAGAVLAALSILVKEVVREDVRDYRDALSSAKSTFLMQSDFLDLHRELVGLATHAPGYGAPFLDTEIGSNPDADSNLEALQVRIIGFVEAFEAELDNVDALFRSMDVSAENKKKLESLYNDAGEIEKSIEAAAKMQPASAQLSQFREVQREAEKKEREAFVWVGQILTEADKQGHLRDTKYDRVKHITYGLLIFAALTGFLGTILNVKELKAE